MHPPYGVFFAVAWAELAGSELRRIPVPRTSVNKGRSKVGVHPKVPKKVEIVAMGDQGRSTARKNWTFTVAQ